MHNLRIVPSPLRLFRSSNSPSHFLCPVCCIRKSDLSVWFQDNGFGPLITADGSVVDVEAQEVQMQVGTQVKSVAFRDLQLLPETAPKRNAHLIQQPAARSVEPARKPARVDHGEKPAQSVVPGSTGTHCSPCHFVVYSFPLLMLFYILF